MQAPPASDKAPAKSFLQIRAFTSVLIALVFLAIVVSGFVLFLSPPGRVANWTNWRILGLTKHDWTDLHVWFGVIFLVAAVVHLVFNFRPLLSYFKDRLTRSVGFRPEWVMALGVCMVVFGGVRAGVPPFSSLLAFNERVKKSWEDPGRAAPIPHAELLTLKELAVKAGVPLDTALQRLATQGVKEAAPDLIVAKLAAKNELSAQRVYEIIKGTQPAAGRGAEGETEHPGAGGGGFGLMTLEEFCQLRGVDLAQAQARLRAKGIKLAPGATLRELAQDNGYDRPHEIMPLIEGTSQ